ncbi:MAG: T9SS type A sorting domain-containing protein [Janthinobacterium lividum]
MRLRYSLSLLVGLILGLYSHAASAQIVAPEKGGGVGVVWVTATTMELSFGTSGTGQGRVVAIAATNNGMPVPLAAVDGQTYNAATTYGQGDALGKGYVVYNGSDHKVTVTGLKPNTYYYITNAEYNADSTDIAYNTYGTSISRATNDAQATPLPVELTSFTGSVDARNLATLHWATASEHNTAYFALERSSNGTSFSEAGRVAAAGSSSQTLPYHWADPQLLANTTYYRLCQIDHDGTLSYSSVIVLVPAPHIGQVVEVYPNPSAGQEVKLLLQGYNNEPITLRLSDALGRAVLMQSFTPADTYYLTPISLPKGLASGTYVLSLTSSSSSSSTQKRLIVSTN